MSSLECMMALQIGLIYGIMAFGVYLTFRLIDFPDLTCDGSFVTGAAASVMALKVGISPWISLLIAMGAGGAAGLTTGVLATQLRINPLLSGILVAFMLYSINLKILGNVPNISLMEIGTVFTALDSLWVLLGLGAFLCVAGGYMLTSHFGLALQSIGQNTRLARKMGIHVSGLTLVTLTLSNGIIGGAGALWSQREGFVDMSQGLGTVIMGLAAVMIGEKILPFRSLWWTAPLCLFGSIVYRFGVTIALYSDVLGLETQDLNLITGLLIICVMVAPRLKPFSFTVKRPC